uniref:Uncharacterized protein n=1 Tax=Ciona intestinalis TaxID=7719 RepID=H2XM37_CIOIN
MNFKITRRVHYCVLIRIYFAQSILYYYTLKKMLNKTSLL